MVTPLTNKRAPQPQRPSAVHRKEDPPMSKLVTTIRRTTAADIFDLLHGQITSFSLAPGTKISEVEIAKQFDVSRGPVREAFIRLANLDLLMVRPQKATVVRRFSSKKIQRARFVRLAIECEVLRRACADADPAQIKRFDHCGMIFVTVKEF